MKNFGERYGYVESKLIQLESIDNDLRMRLYNFLIEELKGSFSIELEPILKHMARKYFVVEIQDYENSYYYRLIREEVLEKEWFKVYSFIEFITPAIIYLNELERRYDVDIKEELNKILEEQKSAYRYVENMIVPISNEEELASLNDSSNTHYDSINTHIKKAIKLYSDRINPDYENSIKESISGVEAICCTIAEKDNATLGSALDRLKSKGVHIHSSLNEAFKKLYGYTSDENGIRHAGIEFKNAPSEDAKLMLISCSAFVNYLIEKYEKVCNVPKI